MHRRRRGVVHGIDRGPWDRQGSVERRVELVTISVYTQSVMCGLDHMNRLRRGSVLVNGRELSQQRAWESQEHHS